MTNSVTMLVLVLLLYTATAITSPAGALDTAAVDALGALTPHADDDDEKWYRRLTRPCAAEPWREQTAAEADADARATAHLRAGAAALQRSPIQFAAAAEAFASAHAAARSLPAMVLRRPLLVLEHDFPGLATVNPGPYRVTPGELVRDAVNNLCMLLLGTEGDDEGARARRLRLYRALARAVGARAALRGDEALWWVFDRAGDAAFRARNNGTDVWAAVPADPSADAMADAMAEQAASEADTDADVNDADPARCWTERRRDGTT